MDAAPAAAAPGAPAAAAAATAAAAAAVPGSSSQLKQEGGTGIRRGPQPTPNQLAVESTSESIHRAISLLHEIELNVTNFAMHQQLLLLDRLRFLVNEFSAMQTASSGCNIQIPVEVIRFIDGGLEPDQYSRDLLKNCEQRNQATKGKVDAFKDLRKHLLDEMDEAFPEEIEYFREMRSAALAESRRLHQNTNSLANVDVKAKGEHL